MASPKPACKSLAVIDASRCIGCNFCRQACPFDAIVGAPGYLYSVVDGYCTGCSDCVAPCPVDCISIIDNHSFPKCTHEERVLFAKESKLRARNLVTRLAQKDLTNRAQFNDLKRQAQQQAVSKIDALKQKLSNHDHRLDPRNRSVQDKKKRDA